MKRFKIKTKFIFSGTVEVKAETALQAKILVENNMWASNPTISDSGCIRITDWDVDCHASVEAK